jgi:hypothetical protein
MCAVIISKVVKSKVIVSIVVGSLILFGSKARARLCGSTLSPKFQMEHLDKKGTH